jgi:hypothetical protein
LKYAKNDFFSISTGYGIWGAQNDRTGVASIFTIEVDLPRPLSTEIWTLMWVKMTENHQNFLFSGMRHGVSNRMGTWWGSFLVFGQISDLCFFLGQIGPIGREVLVILVSSLYKYCLLPKGEKIGPRRPNEPLAGHGASGTNFFDCQGLRVSLTQTLKNEEAI